MQSLIDEMKRIIVTFDYELFFGRDCGSVNGCLISPTKKILEALHKVGGNAVFFVDYLMLKRMGEECEETRADARNIEKQLKEIVSSGSRIELHLHPHWVDAKYKGNGVWDFSDYRHYCLSSLPKEDVTRMFQKGVDYLNGIAREIVPDYRVCAFRAGGWAVMPFEYLRDGFLAAGINIDSSVCSRMTLNGVNYKMDFTNSPQCDIYQFTNEVLDLDAKGQFLEVPISSFRFNPITYILNSLDYKLHRSKYRHYAAGSYMSDDKKSSRRPLSLWRRLFIRSFFGLDTISKVALWFHLVWSRRTLTVLMGHPKDLNDAALENIRFLRKCADFTTYDALMARRDPHD